MDAGDWGGAAFWLARTIGGAALALVDQTTALQRRGATQVGVIIYVMPVVVPVVLAPLLVGEAWGSSAAPLALSVAAVCAGAASLSGTSQVRQARGRLTRALVSTLVPTSEPIAR